MAPYTANGDQGSRQQLVREETQKMKWTLAEVVQATGYSKSKIERAIQRGELKQIKPGLRLFALLDLFRWLGYNPNFDELWTAQDVAQFFGVSSELIYRLGRAGLDIPRVKHGRLVRWLKSNVIMFLESPERMREIMREMDEERKELAQIEAARNELDRCEVEIMRAEIARLEIDELEILWDRRDGD